MPETSAHLRPRRFLDRKSPPHILTLILLASVSGLALNIFLPSLPGMTAYFDTEYGLMQMAVAFYLGMNAVLQLVVGPISDRYGRRPILLAGLIIFLLATLGCIWASNVWVFLGFRMAQAFVVVTMVLSRAAIRDMVPEREAASMIGYVTMGMAVAPMLGPAIGGSLDAVFGWQASFWALFILGAIVLALTWADLGETAPRKSGGFAAQLRDSPELFRSPRFWGYAGTLGLASGAFFAYLGGGPYVGDRVFGMDPATFGIYFGAPAVGYFLGNFLSGRFSIQVGVNNMVLTGCIICASGISLNLLLFAFGVGTPLTFFGLMSLMGLGNGLVIPNATAGALSVRPHLAGTASGLSGALMIGLGAALSALAGVVLNLGLGAVPLLIMMAASAYGAIITILLVIQRERKLIRGG
jgi:DHA1 family bicyclomycin/chloramphenicol resistance-like MFS transporter